MTTIAKIEANRRNALLSTGPRTAAGKAIVAANAIRHGIFAKLPVVPGEAPEDWETHRSGILESLAPVGLLEVTFAERAALLLWQLARLARFQAASITADVEDAGLSSPDADPFTTVFSLAAQREDEILKCAENNLRLARRDHAEVLAANDLLRQLDNLPTTMSVRRDLAQSILSWASGIAFDYPLKKFEPEHYIDNGFLSRIGVPDSETQPTNWTPELLLRALAYYGSAIEGTAMEFRADVQECLDGRVAALMRQVKRLESERVALVRRAECRGARMSDAALLPPEAAAERVMKYERHLQGQLMTTLHELERLQDRRDGMLVLTPAAVDINVSVNGE